MDFRFQPFEPPEALRSVLRQSFFARGRIPYRADKILPNGLAVVIFNIGKPHRLGKSPAVEDNRAFTHSWLHGVQTTPVFNLPGGETHVLGLLFEPAGFHTMFGTDMRVLTDRTVDAGTTLPSSFTDIVEAQLGLADRSDAHRAIHDALLAMGRNRLPHWLSPLCELIRVHRGAVKLGEAYAATGCSARHVNARFKKAVGVSPKVLCRIYRLQALLEAVDPAETVNWTSLAHEFDFYDQAHFNREFAKFTGFSPSRYLRERRRDLPDLAKGESVHFAPQR